MDSGGSEGYLAGMRNPTRTVLMLATLLIRTGMNAAEMPGALTWPKIGDPSAVVRVAREIIAREMAKKPTLSDRFMVRVDEPRFVFSGVTEVRVGNKNVLITLWDVPFTGRGFLILDDARQAPPAGLVQVQDTATPEIKRVLLKLPTEWFLPWGSVAMRDLKQLAAEKASGPLARVMSLPVFPSELLRAAISGKVQAEFTVKADGTVGDVETRGEIEEFKREVRAALEQWRFVPGVDRTERTPTATRLAVTVEFAIRGEGEEMLFNGRDRRAP